MKKIFATAVAALAVAVCSTAPASASILVWNLVNVTFSDGGTASGSFNLDTASDVSTAWDITTTAGSKLGAAHYTNSDSIANANAYFSPSEIFLLTSGSQYLNLAFASDLTGPGTVALRTDFSYECNNCGTFRLVTGGSVTTSGAVPEPATWALMIGGFGLAGATLRRRKAIAA